MNLDSFLLSSFSLMALIIILTAFIFYITLKSASYQSDYKKWMLIYLIGLLIWHVMGFISGGIHSEWRELTYRYTNTLFNLGVSVSLVGMLQISYLFPISLHENERKWALKISVVVVVFYVSAIFWYHFISSREGANASNYGSFVNPLAGLITLMFNIWITLVFFRKSLKLKFQKSNNALPTALLSAAQLLLVLISFLFIKPGIGHPWVLPIYIYGLWIIIQFQCIIFIVYSAFPIPIQTKLLGFTISIMMSILSITIMAIVPFTTNSDAENNLIQRMTDQPALIKLSFVIFGSFILIVFILPVILKRNLILPLNNLVEGMNQVNRGNLDISLPEGVKDEIGIVTHNFNKMVISLKSSKEDIEKYTDTLEFEVKKRTEELTNSIEKLKDTQSQLIHAEKMASLGELTAGIAHEIQNPLNFVNNFSELSVELAKELKEEVEKFEIPVKDKEYLSEIITDLSSNQKKINLHGQRASSIVKGMLEHSRKSMGKKEATDINALCDEYLRLAYHGLKAKDMDFNAELITDFDPTLPKIEVIPQDISRVILNIINNAFYTVNERSKKGEADFVPTVSVTTELTANNQLLIAVKDNGSGIPAHIKDKIFQPFFTTKPTGQGTGLGLSLSFDIVMVHGGELKLESIEGEGTVFMIKLPF